MLLECFNDGSYLYLLYIILNLIAFAMFAIDKRKAIKNKWRISEAALIFASVFGIIGGLCGMYVMHHKTKKPKFFIGLPIILISELAAVFYIIFKL